MEHEGAQYEHGSKEAVGVEEELYERGEPDRTQPRAHGGDGHGFTLILVEVLAYYNVGWGKEE